ncbi:K02A2.6-like [Cordylochernes scorpioides]|uniref:K02A2.6-like n=1 Tax=Cordylochernes scorpioides TaxID=51811 RepID=A0ABY6KAC7_9ARAC|nr:K02A2.6-like [Cordylochernes scorpioides]
MRLCIDFRRVNELVPSDLHPLPLIETVLENLRALRSYERNYTISALECLAIVECVDKFRVYILGTRFVIYSDHHALQWLKTIKDHTGRLFRWSLRLSAYDYEVKYLKGSRQYEADLLSRNPFCGFLSTGQIKDHQGELRRDTRPRDTARGKEIHFSCGSQTSLGTLQGTAAEEEQRSLGRALRSYERNYTISALECLAIVECVDKFRVYILGTRFVIYSDHHALQWLKTIKDHTGRLFRWSLRLSAHDYEVKYLKGSRQYEADLLSRNPFCGFLSTGQIKDHQGELRRDTRFLTNEQNLCRLATCEDMMEMTRTDPEWKDKIITGDETWVYGYDPETKPQSAEWRDIAPNDFFLFPKLKAVLKGRHFDTRDDIIEKSPLALKSIPKEAYKNCFNNWEKRWR